ncbi:CST complex subunit TEN1 isoform X1 [Pleurodeles waltl]
MSAAQAPQNKEEKNTGRIVPAGSCSAVSSCTSHAIHKHCGPRLSSYNLAESRATLTAQHDSTQQQIFVGTNLVEPWCAQVGSLYMALGEVELPEGGLPVLQARVLTCVDGIDLPLLERAVLEQRKYLGSRGVHGKNQEDT